MAKQPPILLWFRRDLRLSDHQGLTSALDSDCPIIPLYIYSDEEKRTTGSASKWWLHYSLKNLEASIRGLGGEFIKRQGDPSGVIKSICQETGASCIHASTCFDPFWQGLDKNITRVLGSHGIEFKRFPGQLMWNPRDIRNKSGKPFQVFTPFWKHLTQLSPPAKPLPSPRTWPKQQRAMPKSDPLEAFDLLPSTQWDSGFHSEWMPGENGAKAQIDRFGSIGLKDYPSQRDFPGVEGTSKLSPHLHFGEITPSQIYHHLINHQPHHGASSNTVMQSTYMKEMGWREFAHHLLHHFPHMTQRPLRQEFDAFPWRHDEAMLRAWQKGQTGYPIVDAGMRELWTTGWMHNRVRMIAGSFLVKHLLLDWKQGAEWFWDTLVDADSANNTMGWQWIAGCGADAAPYFRIFNPITQSLKFDANGTYIRKWIPEISALSDKDIHTPWTVDPMVLQMAGIKLGKTYPTPIVNHTIAREVALDAYQQMRQTG